MNMYKFLNWIPPKIASKLFGGLKAIPQIKKRMDSQYNDILADLQNKIRPYKDSHKTYTGIPETGLDKNDILEEMQQIAAAETSRWKDGFASGAVYSGDAEHIEFLNRAYAIQSQSNPLHPDLWPSSTKYESEIVAMTARMLGAERAPDETEPEKAICGVVTSGGTESILLAVKTYRDMGRALKGIKKPEIVVPSTAHAAFDKAAQYFNVKIVHVPVNKDFMADVEATQKALTRNTIAVVGSAPSFPHGIIDPIKELSDLARSRDIGFHTDACLGGFVLPWAKKIGCDIRPFDFGLPGVTSISADTHKYGYAPKGTSVLLYRGPEIRRHQYFKIADWPGGLYYSPTFAGSRPGALSAACWASMVAMGQSGYIEAARKIMQTASVIKEQIKKMPELSILGEPLWVIAFASKKLDIYRVLDYMTEKSWSLNALHKPPALHLCVTLRHTQPGIAERFVRDLKDAIEHVKANPKAEGGMAPIYGMAATLPARTAVEDLLERYIDMLYEV